MKPTLIVDADDTLWENEAYYQQCITEFGELMATLDFCQEEAERAVDEIERERVPLTGYGPLQFAENMVIAYERLCEPDSLAVAFGQLADRSFTDVLDAAFLHDMVDVRAAVRARHALEPGDEVEIARHRHVGVERDVLREIADAATHFDRLVEHAKASHVSLASCWRQEAREDAHRCRFTGAVRPEKAENLAFLGGERHV